MKDNFLTCIFASGLALVLWFLIGSPGNLAWVQARQVAKWQELGFHYVGSEGHEWGRGGFGTPWGGAEVWATLHKIPDNGLTYSGYLMRWGDEVQVYTPHVFEMNVYMPNGQKVPQ